MNKMKLPGFTAEKSVYKTGDRYRISGIRASIAGGRKIIPQQYDWVTDCEGDPTFGAGAICTSCGTVPGYGYVCTQFRHRVGTEY